MKKASNEHLNLKHYRYSIDVEFDASSGSLNVNGKTGSIRGKIVNINMNSLYKKIKVYLYGESLSAIDYGTGYSDLKKTNRSRYFDIERKRQSVLWKFDSCEIDKLFVKTRAEYIVGLYKSQEARK